MKKDVIKRISALICVAVLVAMTCVPVVSAEGTGLSIAEFYPKNGATGTALDNMDVKVYFSENVYNKATNQSNKKYVKLYNTKTGKEVGTQIAFNEKEKDVMLVLANTDKNWNSIIKDNTQYTCEIQSGFVSTSGDTLGETQKTTFTTQNSKTSGYISFGMMGVMVVGMIFMTMREAKKQAREAEKKRHGNKAQKETVNPYKVAKKTGKSVEEVVAEDQKKKAREASRAKAKAERQKREHKTEIADGNLRVHGPAPISAGGATYKTGRKAIADQKRAEAKKKKAAQQAKKQQSKNKQKKKK